MTAREFERQYAANSGVSVRWMRHHNQVVRPCACGEEGCHGFQSISMASAWRDSTLYGWSRWRIVTDLLKQAWPF